MKSSVSSHTLPSYTLAAAVLVALSATAAACGGESANLPPPPPPTEPAPSASPPPEAPPAASAPPAAPAAPPVTLQPGPASPDPAAPLPTVKIAAPAKGAVLKADKAGDTVVKLDVKKWETAPGASHVHLILDNRPYKAIYDTKAPVKLSELTGGEPLAEGQHVLVAFPSRANHESVKTAGAVAVTEFWVGKKGEATVDLKKPLLVYSRPKGAYNADKANHVLVDFQVQNVTLAEGKEHVAVSVTGPGIDGELTAKVEKFGTPLYLDNLRNGTYSVKVELQGEGGKALPGPWNSTTREIKIDHDAPPDPTPHADHGDKPAPSKDDKGAGKPAAAPGKPAAKGATKK